MQIGTGDKEAEQKEIEGFADEVSNLLNQTTPYQTL